MQWQIIEVTFAQGLDENKDDRALQPGVLLKADNIVFDKIGALNKRRGYDALAIGTDLFGTTCDEFFMHLADHNGELLLLGGAYMYAVLHNDDGLPSSRAIVRRGPCPRGNCWRHDVATAATGKETELGG